MFYLELANPKVQWEVCEVCHKITTNMCLLEETSRSCSLVSPLQENNHPGTGAQGFMPPFSNEPAEKRQKKVSFLSQCVRDPAPKSRATGSNHAPFGDEPPECRKVKKQKCSQERVNSRPFQSEGDEVSRSSHRSSKRAQPTTDSGPFRSEPEEGPVSGDDASSDSSAYVDTKPKDTVFSLGWHAAQRFVAGSFWKENLDEDTSKPKRTYDNSTRGATALYARKGTGGAYKANGVDPARIKKLFDAPSCQCGWIQFRALFTFFLPNLLQKFSVEQFIRAQL